MPTNLLAIPLCQMTVATGTNEDWVDAIKFMTDDGSESEDMPQLDLRGIVFELEVRRTPPDHEVVLNATTEDGSIFVGDPPNYGYLVINVDLDEMKIQQPGEYVADIIGKEYVGELGALTLQTQRVVATIDLTIIQGITRF
jgi:hypothetical protein